MSDDVQLQPKVTALFCPGFKKGPRDDYFKALSKPVQESIMVAASKVSNMIDFSRAYYLTYL